MSYAIAQGMAKFMLRDGLVYGVMGHLVSCLIELAMFYVSIENAHFW